MTNIKVATKTTLAIPIAVTRRTYPPTALIVLRSLLDWVNVKHQRTMMSKIDLDAAGQITGRCDSRRSVRLPQVVDSTRPALTRRARR